MDGEEGVPTFGGREMKLLRRKRVMEMTCCTKNDEECLMDQPTSFSLLDGIMSQESVMNVETTAGRIACSVRTKYISSLRRHVQIVVSGQVPPSTLHLPFR